MYKAFFLPLQMNDLELQKEAVQRLNGHIERVVEALEMGPEAKESFTGLLHDLSDSMNFDLIPPKDMQDSIGELKKKIDTDVTLIMGLDMDSIIAHSWYLTQMFGFISQKQAWCESRSLQLKYAIRMNEAGVTWSLSKKARTLAERIQKGLTNPDKEAIAQMTTVRETQLEVYYYFVSRLLKGLMDTIYQQQRVLSDRHQKLFSEWRDANRKNFADGPSQQRGGN